MAVHYVLDGYNIIKKTSRLADLSLEEGRNQLLRLIEQHQPQGSANNSVTIVFDGQPDMGGEQGHPFIRVLFSSHETADDKIKRLVDQADNRKSICVVTDDREIQYYVRALGANIASSQDFINKILPGDAQAKPTLAAKKKMSKTMESEINAELKNIWLKKSS